MQFRIRNPPNMTRLHFFSLIFFTIASVYYVGGIENNSPAETLQNVQRSNHDQICPQIGQFSTHKDSAKSPTVIPAKKTKSAGKKETGDTNLNLAQDKMEANFLTDRIMKADEKKQCYQKVFLTRHHTSYHRHKKPFIKRRFTTPPKKIKSRIFQQPCSQTFTIRNQIRKCGSDSCEKHVKHAKTVNKYHSPSKYAGNQSFQTRDFVNSTNEIDIRRLCYLTHKYMYNKRLNGKYEHGRMRFIMKRCQRKILSLENDYIVMTSVRSRSPMSMQTNSSSASRHRPRKHIYPLIFAKRKMYTYLWSKGVSIKGRYFSTRMALNESSIGNGSRTFRHAKGCQRNNKRVNNRSKHFLKTSLLSWNDEFETVYKTSRPSFCSLETTSKILNFLERNRILTRVAHKLYHSNGQGYKGQVIKRSFFDLHIRGFCYRTNLTNVPVVWSKRMISSRQRSYASNLSQTNGAREQKHLCTDLILIPKYPLTKFVFKCYA